MSMLVVPSEPININFDFDESKLWPCYEYEPARAKILTSQTVLTAELV